MRSPRHAAASDFQFFNGSDSKTPQSAAAESLVESIPGVSANPCRSGVNSKVELKNPNVAVTNQTGNGRWRLALNSSQSGSNTEQDGSRS